MGSNFYWFKEEKPESISANTGLHIGKLSYGWVFHFQIHSNKGLVSYHQWRQMTRNGFIYNEYGEYYTYDKFWEVVELSKEEFDGKTPLSFDTCGKNKENSIAGIAEYMNNGYMFTDCDFS